MILSAWSGQTRGWFGVVVEANTQDGGGRGEPVCSPLPRSRLVWGDGGEHVKKKTTDIFMFRSFFLFLRTVWQILRW